MSRLNKKSDDDAQTFLEQTMQYEKKIYDLEQMLDIAKSFSENLDFSNLLESIVYICMAQMHVLGAEIFVRDLISNDSFILETEKVVEKSQKTCLTINPRMANSLQNLEKPLTLEEFKEMLPDCNSDTLKIIEDLSPTLIVPLVQKNHLNGLLILQERIAIEDDTSYTEYEQNQIMSIATLAALAINNVALLEKASTDQMTHLKLKYYFYNVLSAQIDAAFLNNQNIAVLMMDIDFFKKFNDSYGHECGDFVLIQVADLIRKSLRDTDVASRYGGEEFTVLLTEAGESEAMLVAERIRQKIENFDFVYNNQHLHVTISIGVSVFDAETNLVNSPAEFVNQADQALYMSKDAGRNRVTYFNPEENKQ